MSKLNFKRDKDNKQMFSCGFGMIHNKNSYISKYKQQRKNVILGILMFTVDLKKIIKVVFRKIVKK